MTPWTCGCSSRATIVYHRGVRSSTWGWYVSSPLHHVIRSWSPTRATWPPRPVRQRARSCSSDPMVASRGCGSRSRHARIVVGSDRDRHRHAATDHPVGIYGHRPRRSDAVGTRISPCCSRPAPLDSCWRCGSESTDGRMPSPRRSARGVANSVRSCGAKRRSSPSVGYPRRPQASASPGTCGSSPACSTLPRSTSPSLGVNGALLAAVAGAVSVAGFGMSGRPADPPWSCSVICSSAGEPSRRGGSKAAMLVRMFLGVALLPTLLAPVATAGAQVRTVAAGDIACANSPCQGQRATARLVRGIDPDAVLALGDLQYERGGLRDFRRSYDPTWGTFRSRTYPVPGNHEYLTPAANGFFRYFHARLSNQRGWYSFVLGMWHLVALNSRMGLRPSSNQLSWLRRDLRRDHHRCELAYFHHPRWSSGTTHGNDAAMGAFWRVLFRHGVDVVLNGHEHNYERFAKLKPSGSRSPRGIREFVVGAGGILTLPVRCSAAGQRGPEKRLRCLADGSGCGK